MDERRGDQPAAGSHPPIASAGARLSPVQEAYGRLTRHSLTCPDCRDLDRGPCVEAAELRQTYRELSSGSMDQVARKSS